MDLYFKLIIFLVSAEVFRRFVMVLINGFTGPLSKIPGPFHAKLTPIPWMIDSLRGEQMNTGQRLIQKYGETVRISTSKFDEL